MLSGGMSDGNKTERQDDYGGMEHESFFANTIFNLTFKKNSRENITTIISYFGTKFITVNK